MIPYLLHSSLLISGVVLFYWVFLKQETFFSLNRWTFFICILLSLGLPLLSVPATLSIRSGDSHSLIKSQTSAFTQKLEPNSNRTSQHTEPAEKGAEKSDQEIMATSLAGKEKTGLAAMSLGELLQWTYFLGVLIFFLLFIVQLTILLTKMYSLNAVRTGRYQIVELIKDEAPYSFWNTIFINPALYDPETYEQIIEHEKLHIDQAHFIDKLLAEFVVILFWFNPFAWMLRNTMTNNLEFLTDQSLLSKGMEKQSYQMSLLKVSVSQKPFNLTTNYNNSFLKNRIIMMNEKRSSITSVWKYLFIIPLFFLSVITMNAVSTETTGPAGISMDNATTVTAPPAPAPGKYDKVQKTLNLPPIDKIANGSQGELILTSGSKQEIRVEGPSEIIENLNLEVVDGRWNIGMKNGWRSTDKSLQQEDLKIYATLTSLKLVALSGTGNVTSTNRFRSSDPFRMVLSGTGNMTLEVDAADTDAVLSGSGNFNLSGKFSDMNITLSGSGNINLDGSAGDLGITLSGSGGLNAEDLVSKNASITSSGSGGMKLHVSGTMTINSHSGSGSIRYKGNPSIKQHRKTGSGSIRAI